MGRVLTIEYTGASRQGRFGVPCTPECLFNARMVRDLSRQRRRMLIPTDCSLELMLVGHLAYLVSGLVTTSLSLAPERDH
jgi:hypothetical protein